MCKSLIYMVPKLGIEPRWCCHRWILSLRNHSKNRLNKRKNAISLLIRGVLQGITVLFCAIDSLTQDILHKRLLSLPYPAKKLRCSFKNVLNRGRSVGRIDDRTCTEDLIGDEGNSAKQPALVLNSFGVFSSDLLPEHQLNSLKEEAWRVRDFEGR